jgi:hypothetical protein
VRNSTSISPDPSAVKRVEDDSGMKRTLDGSLKIAVARPRQRSTSIPCQTPRLSGSAKPATPVWMPQIRLPRARIASSVGLGMFVCATAPPPIVRQSTAAAAARPRLVMVIASLLMSPAVIVARAGWTSQRFRFVMFRGGTR